jgi:hypothetical protein
MACHHIFTDTGDDIEQAWTAWLTLEDLT